MSVGSSQIRWQQYHHTLWRIIWKWIDILYPPRCGGCDKKGYRWCNDCSLAVEHLEPAICEICGDAMSAPGICARCAGSPPHFTKARSWGVYSGVLRSAIHRLKYQSDIGIAEILAEFLAQKYMEQKWNSDMVVPIPLSNRKMKERGYNQTTLLAAPLAYQIHLPLETRALRKVKETPSQTTFSIEDRRNNLAGVFSANPQLVKNKKILLIDDVITTGATIDAGSEALIQAGATEIFCLSLARTVKSTGRISLSNLQNRNPNWRFI